MDRHLVMTVILLGFALMLAVWFVAMPWLVASEKRRQRRAVQSGTIGTFDELFHPEARQAHLIWEAQVELPAPAPLPGDGFLRDGKITLEVPTASAGATDPWG